MPKKVTTEDFIKKAREIHGDKYDYSMVKYVKNSEPIVIICPIHGEFKQTPANHTHKFNKSGCNFCAKTSSKKKRSLGKEDFIKKAIEAHGNKYDYSKVKYVNNSTDVIIICPKHGDFSQTPGSHLYSKCGCPNCSGNKKMSTEDFIKKAREVHGDKYDYSKAVVRGVDNDIKIICPDHGEFGQTPYSHLKGSGCNICSGNQKKSTEDFIREAKLVHKDEFDYSKVKYRNSKTNVIIICPKHGDFPQRPSHHLKGSKCPRCSGQGLTKITFDECRKYARSLKLEGKKDWGRISNFPDNVPKDPSSYYKEDWKGWGDFLGCYNKWTQQALLTYLEGIKPCLKFQPISVLVTIIEANGLDRYLSLESIKKIQKTKPNTKERDDIVDEILEEILGNNEKELSDDSLEEKEQEELTDDNISEILKDDESEENELSEVDLFQKSLEALDSDVITASLDDERVSFIVTNTVNDLWYKLINEKITINNLTCLDFKNDLPKKIVGDFLEEYQEVVNLKLPPGWQYPFEPLLSQKLYAYRVNERRRFGNFSGTGAAKTVAAILAARYAGARNVLVITFDSTVGYWTKDKNGDPKTSGWTKEINACFPSDGFNIYHKSKKEVEFDDKKFNYLILNYETFQQNGSANFTIDLLERNKIDCIILDEVHCVKQRSMATISKRRDLVLGLCNKAVKINPDCCILPMSATPVINNLTEPRSLVEIIEQVCLDDLCVKPNISNCFELHRRLTNCGIRVLNQKDNILKNNKHTIIKINGEHLLEEAKALSKGDMLSRERLLLPLKLDAVKDIVNSRQGKTILYTHYVGGGIDTLIYDYFSKLGYKVGVYTGNNVCGRYDDLEGFKKGKFDILLGSQPIGTGVDGLQTVSDTLIYLSLPWTKAATDQTDGRINRKGSAFKDVEIFVPLVSIAEKYNWDYRKYNIVTYKETISNAVVDGIVPDKLVPPREEMEEKAEKGIEDWIIRLKEEGPIICERPELNIDIYPDIDDKDELKKRIQSELSDFNRQGKTTRSENMHKKFKEDPKSWYRYHALRKSRVKDWSEVPYEYIATKIHSSDDVIADFGCGENLFRKCESVKNNKVYSFDHVAIDHSVIACDMKDTGLDDKSVDIAVFSLSLWGPNYLDYLKEAHRILTRRGAVYIAEPLSVCEDGKIDDLINEIEKIGFGLLGGLEKRNKFVYITFIKEELNKDFFYNIA